MKLPIVTGNTFTLIVDLRKESPFIIIIIIIIIIITTTIIIIIIIIIIMFTVYN